MVGGVIIVVNGTSSICLVVVFWEDIFLELKGQRPIHSLHCKKTAEFIDFIALKVHSARPTQQVTWYPQNVIHQL
jgi:hypothetical protein